MNITEILKSSAEIVTVARMGETELGRALLKVATGERDYERHMNEDKPKIDDSDIKNDFRYKAGAIKTWNRVIGLNKEAQEVINRAEKKEGRKT